MAYTGFTIPNDVDAAFGSQSEVFRQDLEILAEAYHLNGILSACGVTAQGTPDMTVAVAAGWVQREGVALSVAAGNVTITAADGTNPRVDLISVDNAGAKVYTAGTAAAVPVPPAIPQVSSINNIVLAFVYVPAADTTINTNQIIDKRVFVTHGLVVGGAGTTSTLILRATSGVGAAGADIIFQVGNNGGTEAMRILNNGQIGVGQATSSNARITVYTASSTIAGLTVNGAASIDVTVLEVDRAGSPKWQWYMAGSNDGLRVYDLSINADLLSLTLGGGVQIGSPTGGDKGAGTLNLAGAYYSNGTIGVSAGSFSAITAITSTLGLITQLTGSSDERLKNIIPDGFAYGLAAVLGIRPIKYRWNAESGFDNGVDQFGFTAQNIQTVMPDAVGIERWADGREWYTVNDRAILGAAVNAIQELHARLVALAERN